MKFPKHRHQYTSWIILGGNAEWCYVCGAWRKLRILTATSSAAGGPWNKPSGDPNINPYKQLEKQLVKK